MPALPNHRDETFAQLVVAGRTLLDAYAQAGWKPDKARANPSRKAKQPDVAARIAELAAERRQREVERADMDRVWVRNKLRDLVERCMPEPGPDGKMPEGFKPQAAAQALALIGKDIDMFKEHVELTGKDGGPIELKHRQAHADAEAQAMLDSLAKRMRAQAA
jgi:phage terminase small subunit